jgi:hypothetical protein
MDKGKVLFDGTAAALCALHGHASVEAAFLQLTGARQ